jgi:hypothetical protein
MDDEDARKLTGPVIRESGLADVSMVTLAELFASQDSVLAVALRRAVSGVEQSAQAISGWSSYVDGSGPAQPFPAAS